MMQGKSLLGVSIARASHSADVIGLAAGAAKSASPIATQMKAPHGRSRRDLIRCGMRFSPSHHPRFTQEPQAERQGRTNLVAGSGREISVDHPRGSDAVARC